MNDVHYSSDSDEWRTPPDFFATLNQEFSFTLDPCASAENNLCERYYTKNNCGLTVAWTGYRAFVNPPYSKLKSWVYKCWFEAQQGVCSVMLIPARTDTEAFHTYIWDRAKHQPYPNVRVRFLKGRLRFSGSRNSAPFPSMLVIFNE